MCINWYWVSFMKIQEVLKKHNKKVTPERILLAEWMKQKHLFSANDILREFSEVSRASVFRTLKLFSDIGYLRALNIWEWKELCYEIDCCEKHHHEHMICDSCGDIISFGSSDICKKIFSSAKKMWFHITQHSLNISGRCKNCYC